jgi:primary-amine oxidase
LEITQADGPSFTVHGNAVTWQKWRFRIGFTPREGLVLYTISYEDQGRARPLIYRASLVDMVVPYGDPHPNHNRKNAFDVGEYGIGMLANSLALGCDCLGHIHYFDAQMTDSRGQVLQIKNAICLHEEDYGILWKHMDWRTNQTEVRRSRRLVVSMIATVGNYEYGFFWYFYQDGSIQHEIKLTGIMNTGALPPGETRKYGLLVEPGLYAPNHQHVFCVRLDMMVDGPSNTVCEVHTAAEPMGPDNPLGNAFYTVRTPLRTEQEAQQRLDPSSARSWLITNPSSLNAMSQTPYHPDEKYATGDYPNQHLGGAGLPAWTAANRSIENTNVVVWYVMGEHHIPRLEDWPVMPVAYLSFRLRPNGFFDHSPALDVPLTQSHHCHT